MSRADSSQPSVHEMGLPGPGETGGHKDSSVSEASAEVSVEDADKVEASTHEVCVHRAFGAYCTPLIVCVWAQNQNPSPDFECNICLEPAQDAVISLCGHLYWYGCLVMDELG